MRYIDSWLTGLGLDYIIPKLKANGITTPKKLAQLSLLDMYEVVGVEDSEDRKKLYFLIQRLQTILNNKSEQGGGGMNNEEDDDPAPPPEIPSPTQKKNIRVAPPPPSTMDEELMKSTGTERSSEDDLRVLRKNRRTSMDNSMLSAPKRPDSTETANKADAAAKQARRSSFIPQMERSNSSELAADPNSGDNENDYRGPVAVPTTEFSRKLSFKNNSSDGDAVTAAKTSKVAENGKIKQPARPTATESKASLLQQKQRQLAAEEEALLKLQQRANSNNSNNGGSAPSGRVTKSIRAAPASAPSPPASPPHMPPPPLHAHSNLRSLTAATVGRHGATAASGDQDRSSRETREQRDRSPPPPYDWEEPAPTAAVTRGNAPATSRPSYPPRPEYSPSAVESEQEDDRYGGTDTDSYDYYDPNAEGEVEEYEDDVIEDMAIRVVVRKRPISRKELANGDRDVMEVQRRGHVQIHEPKTKVDLTKIIETQEFVFDDAFEAHETNEVIYGRTIRNLVSFVFDGGKASCFAYGQTGSGKTFTMMGSRPEAPAEAKVNAGLYVLAARDIFMMVREPQHKRLRVFVSCFEIYGGKLFDLLNERSVVKCLEDAKQQVQLPGLTEHQVRDVPDLLDLMSRAHTVRSTGTTGANAESSRSHMVMQIVLREPEPTAPAHQRMRGRPNISIVAPQASGNQGAIGGKLSFIDLAGSERGADTTHNSKQTRMEGAEINTSLLALKEVIRSLERKHGHTPFRGSKLTQVLKDSFVGEKTRTCMVACVSPSHSNCEHTLNTLRYADRVKEHQSSASGNAPSAHHVGSSNYDSMAYDSNPTRPQTASSAAGNPGVAAGGRSRANTGPSSRPATASAANDDSRVEQRPGSSSGIGGRVTGGNVGAGVPKPVSRLPASNAGRSASVSAASSRRDKENANIQQVPPSPSRGAVKDSAAARKGIPMRQGSAMRGAVLSPPSSSAASSQQSSQVSSPSSKKMLRHHSSPVLPAGADRRSTLGGGGRTGAAPPGPLGVGSSRRSSAGGNAQSSAVVEDANEGRRQSVGNSASSGVGQRRTSNSGSARAGKANLSVSDAEVEELSFARSDVEGDERDPFDSTELIQKTVGLLSAHKVAIAEMVEVMKEEMELVQQMENLDDRDSDRYIDSLARILEAKSDAIGSLRGELSAFQSYRTSMC